MHMTMERVEPLTEDKAATARPRRSTTVANVFKSELHEQLAALLRVCVAKFPLSFASTIARSFRAESWRIKEGPVTSLRKRIAYHIGAVLAVLLLTAPLGCSDCETTIATNALPDGTVGIVYSFALASDCGGDFWFLSEGNLPPGIGLQENGILLGTATNAGVSTFTLAVVDEHSGETAFKTFTLKILPAS
jgi:hypothetical protein